MVESVRTDERRRSVNNADVRSILRVGVDDDEAPVFGCSNVEEYAAVCDLISIRFIRETTHKKKQNRRQKHRG